MTALYRTYRPLDFSQVVGQDAVVRTLRNAIETGQVRQAYLFAGPRGTGKTSMARILAKALNAEGGPSADFDPTTRIARSIADGSALDVVEMDAASQRGIDEVREIRERAMLQPVEGHWKVYIVDEAHQLTTAAWNTNVWQRDRTVGITFARSVVQKTKTRWGGGSSMSFRSAFQAAVVSWWASSTM